MDHYPAYCLAVLAGGRRVGQRLDRNLLCVLGAIHRLGHDRRMAARLPPLHEPAVRLLDMVESPILRGLYHPPSRAGGHQPIASRVGRASASQIRRHRLPRVRNLLDSGRSAGPGAGPAADCLAVESGIQQGASYQSLCVPFESLDHCKALGLTLTLEQIQEERRILGVAMTRDKLHLHLIRPTPAKTFF
jgi:hypothetical protein